LIMNRILQGLCVSRASQAFWRIDGLNLCGKMVAR